MCKINITDKIAVRFCDEEEIPKKATIINNNDYYSQLVGIFSEEISTGKDWWNTRILKGSQNGLNEIVSGESNNFVFNPQRMAYVGAGFNEKTNIASDEWQTAFTISFDRTNRNYSILIPYQIKVKTTQSYPYLYIKMIDNLGNKYLLFADGNFHKISVEIATIPTEVIIDNVSTIIDTDNLPSSEAGEVICISIVDFYSKACANEYSISIYNAEGYGVDTDETCSNCGNRSKKKSYLWKEVSVKATHCIDADFIFVADTCELQKQVIANSTYRNLLVWFIMKNGYDALFDSSRQNGYLETARDHATKEILPSIKKKIEQNLVSVKNSLFYFWNMQDCQVVSSKISVSSVPIDSIGDNPNIGIIPYVNHEIQYL